MREIKDESKRLKQEGQALADQIEMLQKRQKGIQRRGRRLDNALPTECESPAQSQEATMESAGPTSTKTQREITAFFMKEKAVSTPGA